MSKNVSHIRPHVTAYQIAGEDKELFVLSNANLVNLSAGDGNPIEIMDLGLALQTLSLERIALDAKSLTKTPQRVPYEIEMMVAELACEHWINH
ncbi:hypothetical protein KAT72_01175 [Aeromonas popoffii]|uniref:Uncharacterized protein n=1 Tax=Aeromonas popoffii TaxID=70856 RepID=A0ABS5GKL3_9GAMM|nr:hypothetical protein [Aeromonas popoffii]MBR7627682.1 hypothetical protein [Aeromonas popoffii]